MTQRGDKKKIGWYQGKARQVSDKKTTPRRFHFVARHGDTITGVTQAIVVGYAGHLPPPLPDTKTPAHAAHLFPPLPDTKRLRTPHIYAPFGTQNASADFNNKEPATGKKESAEGHTCRRTTWQAAVARSSSFAERFSMHRPTHILQLTRASPKKTQNKSFAMCLLGTRKNKQKVRT